MTSERSTYVADLLRRVGGSLSLKESSESSESSESVPRFPGLPGHIRERGPALVAGRPDPPRRAVPVPGEGRGVLAGEAAVLLPRRPRLRRRLLLARLADAPGHRRRRTARAAGPGARQRRPARVSLLALLLALAQAATPAPGPGWIVVQRDGSVVQLTQEPKRKGNVLVGNLFPVGSLVSIRVEDVDEAKTAAANRHANGVLDATPPQPLVRGDTALGDKVRLAPPKGAEAAQRELALARLALAGALADRDAFEQSRPPGAGEGEARERELALGGFGPRRREPDLVAPRAGPPRTSGCGGVASRTPFACRFAAAVFASSTSSTRMEHEAPEKPGRGCRRGRSLALRLLRQLHDAPVGWGRIHPGRARRPPPGRGRGGGRGGSRARAALTGSRTCRASCPAAAMPRSSVRESRASRVVAFDEDDVAGGRQPLPPERRVPTTGRAGRMRTSGRGEEDRVLGCDRVIRDAGAENSEDSED